VVNLNDQKQDLLTAWGSISSPESEYPVAKFSIITGKKKIHSKMITMVEESKSEVIVLTTALGLIQEDIAGIFLLLANIDGIEFISLEVLQCDEPVLH